MKYLFVLLLVLAGCSHLPASKSTQEVLPVIDTHTHTGFSGEPEYSSKIMDTYEQFASELKEANVVAAISHAGSREKAFDPRLDAHHVIHCYGVGNKVNVSDIEAGLKSKKFRCIKIYLGYVHKYAYDKSYHPVYRLAEKYDVPVVFHTGDTYSKKAKVKYSDPIAIDEVAVDFPKVTFVIAHLGNPWTQTATEVAYKNDNVFVEASAMVIGDIKKMKEETVQRYLITPVKWAFGFMGRSDKFMFGTDWPLISIKGYLEAYKQAIPKKYWCKVFYENAVKVFRLQEVQGLPCHIEE